MRHALLVSAALVLLAACPEGCEDVTVTYLCTGDFGCQNDTLCDGRETCDHDHPRADEFGCVSRPEPCPRCSEGGISGDNEESSEAWTEEQFRFKCGMEATTTLAESDCSDWSLFDLICNGVYDCVSDDECSDGVFCNGQERCDPFDPLSSREGCAPGPRPCVDGEETCNEYDRMCRVICAVEEDADGDGSIAIACGGDDCDDNDGNRHPGQPEVCDLEGHDEDCDLTTFGMRDADRDGFADEACQNSDGDVVVSSGTDCNDINAHVHPAAQELCNGIDDNCDGFIDDNVLVLLYPDTDHDGYGAPVAPVSGCLDDLDMSLYAGDCDDDNEQIFPGSIRCVPGGQGYEIEICQDDGTWLEKVCDGFTACVTQPGGHGVCQ